MWNYQRTIAALLVLPAWLACVSAARSASDESVKAANKEAVLLIYGGATLQHVSLLIENFNRTHPAIKVNYLRKSGSSLFELIVRELRAKTYNADAYVPLTVDQAMFLAERKLLTRYASPERSAFPEEAKDRDGYWTTLYQTGHVYAYNTRQVNSKEAPRLRRSASAEMERQDHDGRGGRPLVCVGVGDSRQGKGSKVYARPGAAAAGVPGQQDVDDATALRR